MWCSRTWNYRGSHSPRYAAQSFHAWYDRHGNCKIKLNHWAFLEENNVAVPSLIVFEPSGSRHTQESSLRRSQTVTVLRPHWCLRSPFPAQKVYLEPTSIVVWLTSLSNYSATHGCCPLLFKCHDLPKSKASSLLFQCISLHWGHEFCCVLKNGKKHNACWAEILVYIMPFHFKWYFNFPRMSILWTLIQQHRSFFKGHQICRLL